MSRSGATPRAAASAPGTPTRAAATVSNARAEASRRNGAKSRGPKTPAGKARSAQNALKHGMCAHKHVVLPQEDAAEFEGLEEALLAELAPVGAVETVLARRVAVAAWRLERAERLEAEVLEFRSYEDANPGLALIRDGNATRSFETVLRYRGSAMAEFVRALRTLKALQAERAARTGAAVAAHPSRPTSPPPPARPDEPERPTEYALRERPAPGRPLHEPAASWLSNQPEPGRHAPSAPARPGRVPNEPERRRNPRHGEPLLAGTGSATMTAS